MRTVREMLLLYLLACNCRDLIRNTNYTECQYFNGSQYCHPHNWVYTIINKYLSTQSDVNLSYLSVLICLFVMPKHIHPDSCYGVTLYDRHNLAGSCFKCHLEAVPLRVVICPVRSKMAHPLFSSAFIHFASIIYCSEHLDKCRQKGELQ